MATITVTDTTEVVLAGLVLLLMATVLALTALPKTRGSSPTLVAVIALHGVTILHAGAAIMIEHWWMLALTPIATVSATLAYDTYLAARRGGLSLVALLRLRLKQSRMPPMKSLDVLRAEYAQPVLDDAERDPKLNEVVESAVRNIIDDMSQRFHRPVTADEVVAYANGWLVRMEQPRGKPLPRVHSDYSTELVVLAAACRTAERL